MATSSITANFYGDDAKAANAFVRMFTQPVRTVVRKRCSLSIVNDSTVDDEDAFVKRFKARWARSIVSTARRRNWKFVGSATEIERRSLGACA